MDSNLLKRFIPLCSLTPDKLEAVATTAKIETHPSGTRLFTQGDNDPDSLYLLKGRVILAANVTSRLRFVDADTDDARYALSHLRPRQFTGSAASEVTVARINSSLLDRLTAKSLAPSYDVAEIGSQDVEWILDFFQGRGFHGLPVANINALLAKFKYFQVRAGQVIIQQGEAGEYYYVMRMGEADVLRKSEKTRKVDIIDHIHSGEGFGEEALLTGQPRHSTVVMTTEGYLLRLDRRDFDALLREPLVKWVSPKEAAMLAREGAALVDVRAEEEFSSRSVKGSIKLPLENLRRISPELDRMRSYVVFCQNGQRSSIAAFWLSQRGFTVSVLQGGLDLLTKNP